MTLDYVRVDVSDDDSRFPSLLQGFNRRWSAPNCEAIFLCSSPTGVARAFDQAVSEFGSGLKVVGGGHCYENFVYGPDTKAILDLSQLDDIGVDPTLGYFLGAGGTNWGAFKALFNRYGKVLPSGSCYSVGLGGHISGGGYGLLSRMHGLTSDWLTAVEIVVKDQQGPAQVITVSVDSIGEESDLFWASCGGGGGNFGVITKYYFAILPNCPSSALLATLSWDWEMLTNAKLQELLDWYATECARTDNGEWFGLFKLNHKSAGEIQLVMQWAVDAVGEAHEDARRVCQELNQVLPHRAPQSPIRGHPGYATTAPSGELLDFPTFYEAVQTLNGSGPNRRGKYKSAYMRKAFPPEQVSAIFESLQQSVSGVDLSQSLVQVDSYGGAINTRSSVETPIPQRDSIMKLQYQTYWSDEKQDAACLNWIRTMYENVYRATHGVPDPAADSTKTVDGCYYNYPDVDLNQNGSRERAMRLYFGDNYRKNSRNLVATKARWDPMNYLNSSQSVAVN